MYADKRRTGAVRFVAALFACCVVFTDASAQETIFPGQTGEQLRESLVDRYKPGAVLSYDPARDSLFGRIYNVQDSVYCVYTGFAIYIDPNSSTRPRTQAFEQDVNTEHTWPQSKGASSGPARSDLHHLFPTRADVNTSRSNYPFANIPAEQVTRWWRLAVNTTETPTEDLHEWSRTNSGLQRFEVRDDHKGRAARSMFYFYTMYRDEAESADPIYFDVQKNTLYNWHASFPPDSIELARTHLIATYQDGRENPFVLDTSLVRRAYFEDGPPVATFSGHYSFEGYSSTDPCPASFPSAYDYASVDGDHMMFSPFERTGVECTPVNDAFNSRSWPQLSSSDPGYYAGFFVQSEPSYTLNFSSSDMLQFYARRSSTGPPDAAVYYSVDGAPEVLLHNFEPTTGGGTHMVPMPVVSEASSVAFRFHGWGATHTAGTLRFDDVLLTGSSDYSAPLSVDILDFSAIEVGSRVKFSWEAAAREGGRFAVERLSGADAAVLGEVAARGGTARYTFTSDAHLPGSHSFRLMHTDPSGVVSYSETITLRIEVAGAYHLEGPYPNPFNPSTELIFSVSRSENVRVEVYDALGRRVEVLHDGLLPANESRPFTFNAGSLPSGLYFVRIHGESFTTSRTVTLLK